VGALNAAALASSSSSSSSGGSDSSSSSTNCAYKWCQQHSCHRLERHRIGQIPRLGQGLALGCTRALESAAGLGFRPYKSQATPAPWWPALSTTRRPRGNGTIETGSAAICSDTHAPNAALR
jgi:hypothetical protein